MATQGVLLGVAPGGTAVLTAVPVDTAGNTAAMPAGIIPVWVMSDPTLGTLTPSADGLTATILINADAVVGAALSVSVSATLADGTIPAGTAPFPIIAPLATEVASFIITQA